MNYEPQQIVKNLTPLAEAAVQESFKDWEDFHKNRLSELESILNALKILLVHTEEWASDPDSLWKQLESEMARIRLWTESLTYISKEDFKTKIIDNVSSNFDTVFLEIPEEVRILIGSTYWEAYTDDGLFRRLRKALQPIKTKSKRLAVDILNKYRDLRHMPPVKRTSEERIIKLRSLAEFYIRNPLLKFLIDEWQRFLQAITGQLFVLHLNIMDFSNKSLILDELSTILDPEKKNEIFNNLFELAEILKNIDETLQVLKKYDTQFLERFQQSWDQISEEFQDAWNRAGTFQLNNKKYSDEKLTHLEYSTRSRFEKHSDNWKIHLNTLREEWQKDSEISLIRYKTVRSLYGTSQLLHTGIHETIEPYLNRAHNQLTKTCREIEKTGDDNDLRSLITNRRKSILNALQLLLEAIHGVNIVRILENSLGQIDTIVDNIGSRYLIYIRQDTERIPPRSVIEEVPFKELVKNEVYLPFRQKFNVQIREKEAEVKHILRVISEIDQQIEFHTESTLKLIDHSNQLPIFRRAKNEISEGLNRTVKLLLELKSTILNVPEQCSDELLKNSLKFEHDLEKFLDIESLIKFKSHLKGKQARKKLKGYINSFLSSFKSIIPLIGTKFIQLVKKLWLPYFSLNHEMEDYSDPENEKIRLYLTDTEDRISKLPFIYQKLFHFQALNDQQFFTNRIKEIKKIEEEFKRWQNGSTPAISIIGERGSGLTTFLNYVEKQIFPDMPLTRLVFTKPEYSEKNLFKMVCEAFDCKKSDSWDALEKRICGEDKLKICIIENIQFMYLKTVSGFEGIEKFLQFLSRTKNSVFWIVTCTLYSWQFLSKAVGLNSHFQCVLTLHKMNVAELRSIILKRHRASGYHLEFEPSSNPNRKKAINRSNGKPQKIHFEDEYFNKLHEIAGGNIATAILIWLRSIKEFSQAKMVLSTKFEFDFSFLDNLSEVDLMTLGSIIHHEILSVENHSIIFTQNIDKSRLQLENLEVDGLILRNGNGYKIHPFIYRPLIKTLKEVNILS